MELNPNHKVVQQARDHWHKIAALIMVKLNLTELEITHADLEKLTGGNINIVLDARGESITGKLTIRIVDDKTVVRDGEERGRVAPLTHNTTPPAKTAEGV